MKKLPYLLIGLLVFLALAPLFIMITTSLKLKTQIFGDVSSFLFMPTLANYREVLADEGQLKSLMNSLYVALVSTGLTLSLGTLAAYGLERFKFMGREVVSTSTLLLRMVPPAVLTVPVFMIWTFQYGLSNSLSGVILVYTALNLPFVIWIMQSFIKDVPVELEEAALMDGGNPLQVFYHAVLPVIKPGLAAAAIFTFRIAWNEFILGLVLTNRHTRTMPVKVSLLINEHNIEWGQIMAIGTLIAIPPLIFTFLASKQIITGMTAGAVKG
jgi:multiple sugar transport system permease protein